MLKFEWVSVVAWVSVYGMQAKDHRLIFSSGFSYSSSSPSTLEADIRRGRKDVYLEAEGVNGTQPCSCSGMFAALCSSERKFGGITF